MPTGADILGYDEAASAAIGNWQEVAGRRNQAAKNSGRRGQAMTMPKLYSDSRVDTSLYWKSVILKAVAKVQGILEAETWSWEELRK